MNIGTTSQAGQDMYAHLMSGRITRGSFVDLGCNVATFHSNTHSLEWVGWVGLLVDIQPGICVGRSSPFICSDATKPTSELLEKYSALPQVLNYLSVDCDEYGLGALEAFPFDKVQCQSITIEHDRYHRGDALRDGQRKFLIEKGYSLVCADVILPGVGEFEDWWAHPNWTSRWLRDRMRCSSKPWNEIVPP